MMDNFRNNLTELLSGFLNKGMAHVTFEGAVGNIPESSFGIVPKELPYSLWQEVSHIRITQKDILEFCRDPEYKSPAWPKGYWPASPAPKDKKEWDSCISQVINERKQFIGLIKDKNNDLFEPFPHGSGQNLVREALLIIDHTSYHVGQIMVIRRLLGVYS